MNNDRYEEIKEYVDKMLEDIEDMKYYEHKVICLFQLIDAFAQNYFKYNIHIDALYKFINEFADKNKYTYLDKIDPVTLIYDTNDLIDIDMLQDGSIYNQNSMEISRLLNEDIVKNITPDMKAKHTYLKLIIQYRNKIVHEQQSAALIRFETENNYEFPIYFRESNHWRLIMPYQFLKNLFLNCIDNYLIHQKKLNLDPFDNNCNRKSFFAYYD